jgi:hypothetical protein
MRTAPRSAPKASIPINHQGNGDELAGDETAVPFTKRAKVRLVVPWVPVIVYVPGETEGTTNVQTNRPFVLVMPEQSVPVGAQETA